MVPLLLFGRVWTRFCFLEGHGHDYVIRENGFYALHHYCECGILYATHQKMIEDDKMDCKTKIKELRESTGMNRKEFCDFFQIPYRTVTDWERDNRHAQFCDFFQIPYRTVTDWERDNRHAPDYVLRLLEYYIRMERLNNKHDDKCNSE